MQERIALLHVDTWQHKVAALISRWTRLTYLESVRIETDCHSWSKWCWRWQ